MKDIEIISLCQNILTPFRDVCTVTYVFVCEAIIIIDDESSKTFWYSNSSRERQRQSKGYVWGKRNGVKVTEWVGQERIYSDILKRVREKAKQFPGCRAGQRRLPKRKKKTKKRKKGVKSKSTLKKNIKNEEVKVPIKIEIKKEENNL